MEQNILDEKKIEEIKEEKDEEEFFTNVFSNIGNFEKNKRYQQMQKDLDLLQQDVKLLEEFSNKDKISNKKQFFQKKVLNTDKENNVKRFQRGSLIFRNKMKLMNNNNNNNNNNSALQSESNNDINIDIYDRMNQNRESKKGNNRTKDLCQQKYQINLNKMKNKNKFLYKTEVKNYNELINGEKLPNIYFSSDKRSEANMAKNSNSNSSSNLPLIIDRRKISSQKKLYILTDNDIDSNNISINENNYKKMMEYKKSPLKINANLKDNIIIKKFPNILISPRQNNHSINHRELSRNTDKIVRRMKEKNVKIKNRINSKLNEQDIIDWEMKSRFKLAKWKYGIEEVQKYFVDLKAFGKPEEDELIKRKTFYDYVEELIDDIKKSKEEKELKSIEDKYIKREKKNKFGNVKKEEKKDKQNNELNAVDNTLNKKVELSEIINKLNLRKRKEKETRKLIKSILLRSNMMSKNINDSINLINGKKQNKSFEIDNNNKANSSNENEKNVTQKEIEN